MSPAPGLRERKKRATRAALSETALRLAIEHGMAAVSAEVVAEAAGLSPRTFRNYFGSPEEAVVDGFEQRATVLFDALRARPAGEPVWDSLAVLLPDHLVDVIGGEDRAKALVRMFEESPVLMAHQLAVMDHVEHRMALLIAERTGTDAARDLTPHLVAAAAMAATRVSLVRWVEGHPGSSMADLLRQCLAELRSGLPAAGRSPGG